VSIFARLKRVWRDDLQCYLLLWFAFVFLFFSLSGTKLPHYILYGMSGMYILMAVYAPSSRFWALAPALLWFLFLLLLPSALEWTRPHVTDTYYREAFADVGRQFGTAYYVYCAVALAVTLGFTIESRIQLSLKLTTIGALSVLALSAFLVPIGAAIQQDPIKEAALLARSRGWEVIMWRLNAPSFSVYYGQPTMSREPKAGDLVITKAKRLSELQGVQPEMLYAKNGIVLVRIH
jgi:4-amino-4-deoxy-L-arabinose transferase-like glycosyltransferase